MEKRKKQIPNYDIIEFISIIENPEIEIINKAKGDLMVLIEERREKDGYNRSNI